MPDDVNAALERFQNYAGAFSAGSVIDDTSGFTVADAQLLIGQIEMTAHYESPDENPID
jgi:hypothetical protein